ncbi:hypothetical protein GE09DRAFT_1048672 [Coniochaeta sp. 2T2.1]|nr:hypothetical protein GE09DRAFT_1048672 [Coniochaeta sp. 2T2.1]
MPWQPLPRIAFAVASYPFTPSSPADLPLEIGDELYIIEETPDGNWLRGYLVAPPSLLAGLTSVKGQTLEARVFSGIFPRSCVEIREVLGESDGTDDNHSEDGTREPSDVQHVGSDSAKSGIANEGKKRRRDKLKGPEISIVGLGDNKTKKIKQELDISSPPRSRLSVPLKREPGEPRPPAPVPMLKIGDETPTSISEPLIDEIASCLREWHSTNLHELLLSRQYGKLDKLWQLITTLNMARQQFLHNVLTAHEYELLREKTVWDLVRVNKLCGGEVIVRDPSARGRVLTGEDSVVEITTLQSTMSLLDEPPSVVVELTALHHLLVDVKGFAGASSEPTTLVLYLASKHGAGNVVPLSESYVVEVPAGGHMGHLTRNAQMRTLFADLTAADIGDGPSSSEIFLVIKVRAQQQIAAPAPGSRAGSITQNMPSFSKESSNKPPLTAGNKSMRRSLMWAGKSTRQAFSRGNPKLDSLDEQPEQRPPTSGAPKTSDGYPPGTASSKGARDSTEAQGGSMTAERTVGVGVLRLNSIMKYEEDVEHVVSIWTPASRLTERSEGGDEWDPVLRDLVESRSGQYEKSRRAERLQIHLRAFNNPDADLLIKATPTVLSGICKTSKIGFAGAPTKSRSDFYVTIDEAILSRQTLLSRFGSSPGSLPSSLHGNNLQVTLEVRKSTGERVDNCIFASSNTDAVSTWKTVAAERGEPWKQTIRLLVAPQDVQGSHLMFHISDLPGHPFAVAYLPLWEDQAFVRDGPHGLLFYKIDDNTATPQHNAQGRGGYLSLPWQARGKVEHQADVTGPLATLRIVTYLCSTRFSQDRVVLGLLKWKDSPREEIPDLLKQFIFVAEIEVVKLLNDVLDSLFGILVEYQGNDEYEDLVFTALVRVLDIVHDRRFNLAPLVDQYAENKFNYPFATPCLVRSFTRLLSNPSEPETARKLRATFKVVRHILKFITHARGQQKVKEAGIGITGSAAGAGFTRHLRSIFKALDALMRNTSPVLVGSQTLAVQHFHTWLPELAGLLTTEEILHIAIDFVDSCSNVKGKLILYKLVLIINYSRLEIFAHPEQRSALSANTVRWIAPHWGTPEQVTEQWKEQVRLCCSILASQVDHLGSEIPDHIPKIIESYLAIQAQSLKPRNRLSLLFPTAYPFPAKPTAQEVSFDEALIELSAVLSALSNSPTGMQLELADDDISIVVENTLRVQMSILEGEAFPLSWLSVHIFHHKSTMRTLKYLAETILLDSFLPHPDEAEDFNTELWKMFFTTLLKLVGSPTLALETFPEQKRRAVWKIAGDVREDGAELLRRTWEAIGWETSADERQRYGLSKMGGYQVQYVPTLVGPIVELCLSVHEGLRRMAVEVLQTMIVSEWTLSEDLSVIQTEMIDCLDVYFKSKPITESILQKLFVNELLDRFESLAKIQDEPLYGALRDLMGTVDEFLDLLVAVHSGDGVGEATHLIHRLRLMEFLRDMQKEEIFVRYVHQLAILQAEARNHTEAGLALRLHADLYDWDPLKMTPALSDPVFPPQSHFDRKEKVYFEMIKHFEEGEAWTSALDAYKELQVQYETNVYDFAKLARTERAIATIYETLAKSDKLVPKYFKVVYKGLGFPTSLRDKEFVFEGSPAERTSAFTDRMQEQYPAAQIVTSDNIDDVEGQFLVVSAVSPHRDLAHHVFQRARVPLAMRDYVLSTHPQTFSVTRKRNTTGPVTEHYAEKTVYTTAEQFPTILRRSEIVSVQEVRLSAKETALERIIRKTAEMTAVEKRLADGEQNDEITQLLVDAVSISVNPDSENSVIIYRTLLPQPPTPGEGEEDDLEDPQPVELNAQENAIKMALVDHAIMIKRCLAAFGKNPSQTLARHVEDLQKYFESTFAPEIAAFTPPQPIRSPNITPSPTWPRSPPSTVHTPTPQQQQPFSGAKTNDITPGEEVSVVQPVQLRQGRGARLSFLGGRKKDTPQQQQQHPPPPPIPQTNGDYAHVNGDAESASSRGKENNPNRLSFFRSTGSAHPPPPPTFSDNNTPKPSTPVTSANLKQNEWVTERPLPASKAAPVTTKRKSEDVVRTLSRERSEKEYYGNSAVARAELPKKSGGGNVRKRLSMLKLGKRRDGVGGLGGLEEE